TQQGRDMIEMKVFPMSLLLLMGCGGQGDPANPDNPAAIRITGIPSDAPYIQGAITAVEGERILVEENAAQASGSAKASLRLIPSTRIVHRSGVVARPSDLQVGQQVQVWVAGPVMESYPTQGTAAVVVIEP
ncbi:MAG: DUF3221 domain-containing protein, partial [Pseudomonadota bacterium]|nr:DUF3221 domain-containing protein [Pseudomonadota bacterium]MDQ3161161.1 DUF3221 domain-containing protein [Pseudomonadota bacterium]